MLRLTQLTKSGGNNTIPLDVTRALAPEAFRTVHTKAPEIGLTHVSLEWVLHVDPTHDGRFKGHQFSFEVTPDSISALEQALAVAKERFTSSELPVQV